MNHCTIDGSKGFGLMTWGATEIPSFAGNTSVLTGNTNDYVEVTGNSISAALTLNPLTVPYFLSGSLSTTAALTINAGTTVWLGNDVYVSVNTPAGRLNVEGTATNRVKFTRPTDMTYYWGSIRFNTLGSTIEYADFEYGGNANGSSTIFLYYDTPVEISNSTISNSRYWGATMYSGGSLDCTAVTFTNNGARDIGTVGTTNVTKGNAHVLLPGNRVPSEVVGGVPFTGTLQ